MKNIIKSIRLRLLCIWWIATKRNIYMQYIDQIKLKSEYIVILEDTNNINDKDRQEQLLNEVKQILNQK